MNPIATLYSELNENYMYAPGVATYGITGKTGLNGDDGPAVYYSNIPFKNIYFSDIVTRLLNNEIMSLSIIREKNPKPYVKGDIFITNEGEFWRLEIDKTSIVNISDYNNEIYQIFRNVGRINLNSIDSYIANPVTLEDGKTGLKGIFRVSTDNEYRLRIFNSVGSGMDFIDNSLIMSESGDSQEVRPETIENKYNSLAGYDSSYVVNIIGSYHNNYNTELLNIAVDDKFFEHTSKLSVYYSNIDEAFHIHSDKPILFDVSSFRVNKKSTPNNIYDQYSQLNVYESSITNFYANARYCTWWRDSSTGDLKISNLHNLYSSKAGAVNNVVIKIGAIINGRYGEYISDAVRINYVPAGAVATQSFESSSIVDVSSFRNIITSDEEIKYVSLIKNIEYYIPKDPTNGEIYSASNDYLYGTIINEKQNFVYNKNTALMNKIDRKNYNDGFTGGKSHGTPRVSKWAQYDATEVINLKDPNTIIKEDIAGDVLSDNTTH